MFTIRYKGQYIHGHFDRDACTFGDVGDWKRAKSMHAAKCLITKALAKKVPT